MQIPVLNGIYTDQNSDFRTSYPRNMIPVPKDQGISQGYLRPAEGIEQFSELSAIDRGGIEWKGVCYRVCGNKFIKVDDKGVVTEIGDVMGYGQCNFDYSFDHLAINSYPHMYLFDGEELKQITDNDLGVVVDVTWVDGYFMTTDGEFIVVTELNDPFQVNPLKYGSSEADPDPIKALIKVRNEVYALNRYTIEIFDNVGGENFPFARIDGALATRGSLGTKTCCKYSEAVAFLGGGKNEPVALWVSANGSTNKISTREIEQIIHQYDEKTLSDCLMESRLIDGHNWLYLHLPDQTIVYDSAASEASQQPVWFTLGSGLIKSQYLAQNFVWCYGKWIVGHPNQPKLGVFTNEKGEHWGDVVTWEFGTTILYNESRGAIFHQVELACLTGRVDFNKDPMISTQYSLDGVNWSNAKFIRSGKAGDLNKRLVWFQQGYMNNWRMQKFSGTSDSRLTVARLEVQIEPLGV
ncbi:packaged DNA stabilization protein [Acinetobacter bereziniae]|uniref:packaged DNA stabilization protein n=1 Tax=Acinetobacter bereziniae TaxID=106648 RepID=UPI00300BC921